jgi:hypothetical protein
MNKIEINEITSAHVAEWMQMQLAKAHEKLAYADLSVSINQQRGYQAAPRFSIYAGEHIKACNLPSMEECFTKIAEVLAGQTPEKKAERLIEQAATLITEANRILEAEAAKNQPELILP